MKNDPTKAAFRWGVRQPCKVLGRGRIGMGKRTHWIEQKASLKTGEKWGVALCGWAGLLVEEEREGIKCEMCEREYARFVGRTFCARNEKED